MNIYYRIIGIKIEALETELIVDVNRKAAKDVYEFLEQYEKDNLEWILLPCRLTSSFKNDRIDRTNKTKEGT